MFVSTKAMLRHAQKNRYAIGAFNFENMEMAQAIVLAAMEEKAPVILQTTPGTLRYADMDLFVANAFTLARRTTVPVALHLDHGHSFDLAAQAMVAGYSSVMIDGSKEDFEQNVRPTKRVAEVARPNEIPVEAELGQLAGKEDDMVGEDNIYTEPKAAKEFVQRTGIQSLAVAIGTAHGLYKGEPKLDIDRLSEIEKLVDIPLVLHGASGLSEKQLKECINRGICKINFATDLRVAYTKGAREALEDAEVIDPKDFGAAGRARVQSMVRKLIHICGAQGAADDIVQDPYLR